MRGWLLVIAAAVVIGAPLSLLAFGGATFNADWVNNVWMIEYGRAYLGAHGGLPDVNNVSGHVGIPQPIFYGPLLYPVLTVLAVPLGGAWAIRVACAGVWTLQFALVYGLGRRLKASIAEALAAAALMSWSVYPLTNLYNRGALAEFFGTAFLACAMAAGGLAIFAGSARRRAAFALLGALCAAMALGSHAPTALIGGGLLVLLAIPAVFLNSEGRRGIVRRRVIVTIGLALVVGAAVSPWAYAVKEFSGRFSISVPNPFYRVAGGWQRFEWIDSWWARLAPVPLPGQWTTQDTQMHRVRHLDGQWNFPLAVLAAWSAIAVLRRRDRSSRAALSVMAVAAMAAVGLLVLSICRPLQDLLTHPIGAAIQFPYRLVSHVNLAMLAVLLAAWAGRKPDDAPMDQGRAGALILAAVMILALIGLSLKLKHAVDVMSFDGEGGNRTQADWLAKLPSTFVGQDDYTLQIPERVLPDSIAGSTIAPPIRLDAPLGAGPLNEVREVSVTLPAAAWLDTSVLNFPWNRLIVDGRAVPFDEVHNLYFHQAVELPGGVHTLGFRFEPDPVWERLNHVSGIALAVMALAAAVCFVPPRGAKKRRTEGRHK